MKTEQDFAKGKAEDSILNGSNHMRYPTTNTTFPSRIFIQFFTRYRLSTGKDLEGSTVSHLHMNLHVANFQRCKRAFSIDVRHE